MNIISGKLAESLHLLITKLSSYSQFIEDGLNKESVLSTNVINVYDHLIQYSVKLLPESEIKKQKPIIISAYIYAHARMYMFEHIYSIIGKQQLLYTDTDAAKVAISNQNKWLEYAQNTIVPHWPEIEEIDE